MARRASTNRRATAKRGSPAYSAEERETLRRGLRILARMIRPRPPSESGVPLRDSAQADNRARGRRLNDTSRYQGRRGRRRAVGAAGHQDRNGLAATFCIKSPRRPSISAFSPPLKSATFSYGLSNFEPTSQLAEMQLSATTHPSPDRNVPASQSVHFLRPVGGHFPLFQLRNRPTCIFATNIISLYSPTASRKGVFTRGLTGALM